MLKVQRILAVSMCISHLVLGFAILLNFGPVGNSPAWSVLATIWTELGSPVAFLFIGVLAGIGYFDRRSLQFCFYLGAVVMFIWAAALGVAWYVGYGPQPSAVWLANIGIVKWAIGWFWLRDERRTAALDELSNRVAQTVYESQRGRESAGDVGAS